ncbi:MAG: hypothetical protein RR298_00550 [Alistipes sp.]
MGTAYKIKCRHCGTQFDHYADVTYGVLPICIGCGEYTENQTVIRCPGCQRQLNTTPEELDRQIETIYTWD